MTEQPQEAVETARVALRNRRREIVAYALVDASDFEWVSRWRWYLDSDGYAGRGLYEDGHRYGLLMHRELLGLTYGDGKLADHRNRDRLDNRRGNLRVTNAKGNAENCGVRGAASGYRGVRELPSGSWMARCGKVYLGTFGTAEKANHAAVAYREAHTLSTEEVRRAA